LCAALCFFAIVLTCQGQETVQAPQKQYKEPLKDRWFFSYGYKRNRKDVEKIKSLIDIAAEHGLNGMVLSSFGLDSITRWNEKDIALLKEVAAYCEKRQIELIPIGFSVGCGGGALGHDRNFAAALPVSISLKAEAGKLIPVSGENLVKNGDLEQSSVNGFKEYEFHDRPGKVSFVDRMSSSGNYSIRFENFGNFQHGLARIMQKVAVKPGRVYRFSFMLKTKNLQPISGLKAIVYANGRLLTSIYIYPKVKPTQEWTNVSLEYINFDEKEVSLYAGIWKGETGKFWIDDIKFSEEGSLSDIVRREGTPLKLRSRDRDVVFVEGKDFDSIKCLKELRHISLPLGSSIREGENLELSCYKIPYVGRSWGKQISLCMSNPGLYDYWEAQAKMLYQVIKYKRFLLSMDEIRNGGGCISCRKRSISMARILGDCITRQYTIFKTIDPKIEVMIWSDMLDPAHNAHNKYHGVVGDFTGSWKYVPNDVTIVCWSHRISNRSLSFFSGEGFHTFGAAYYDGDDLTNPKEWLVSLSKTPNADGIMYTSWKKKYRLLVEFGDLVSENDIKEKGESGL